MSDSDSDHFGDTDIEFDSKSVPAPKHALKPLASMEDIHHPLSPAEKAKLKKATQKVKKLSDYIQKPTTNIVIKSRRKPDPANATRRLDKKKGKVICRIPTKEVKTVTIEREFEAELEPVRASAPSRKRARSPERPEKEHALDLCEEICDKSDDFKDLVLKLAEQSYYDLYLWDDDKKAMLMAIECLDRAIARANRNVNEMKQLADRDVQVKEQKEQTDEPVTPPPAKRQKSKPAKKASNKASNKKSSKKA